MTSRVYKLNKLANFRRGQARLSASAAAEAANFNSAVRARTSGRKTGGGGLVFFKAMCKLVVLTKQLQTIHHNHGTNLLMLTRTNSLNGDKLTCLDIAVLLRNVEMVRLLQQYNAKESSACK